MVAVTLMRKEDRLLLNLVNTGGDHHGGCYTFDEIPPVGPLELTVRLAERPRSVKLQPGNRRLKWTFDKGVLALTVPRVALHEIIEITTP